MQSENKSKKVVLLGGGGHCKAVIDIFRNFRDYSVTFQGEIKIGEIIKDTRKLTDEQWKELTDKYDRFFITVGQIKTPNPRIWIYNKLKEFGITPMTVISPRAYVSPTAKIGAGTVVMHNASIGADVRIGKCCIINTGTIIEHESKIGNFSHISTGAIVNGQCVVKDRTFIGSRAMLYNNVEIPFDSIIRAGDIIRR